jgi:hypothetical protein
MHLIFSNFFLLHISCRNGFTMISFSLLITGILTLLTEILALLQNFNISYRNIDITHRNIDITHRNNDSNFIFTVDVIFILLTEEQILVWTQVKIKESPPHRNISITI